MTEIDRGWLFAPQDIFSLGENNGLIFSQLLAIRTRLLKERYIFMAHDYGPYSPELQSDLDDLMNSGFLRANR
jgi:hypothetical protein